MPAGFVTVVGRIADGVTTMELIPKLLDRVFQGALAVEPVLGAASGLGERLHRIVLENRLRIAEQLYEQRDEFGAAGIRATSAGRLRDSGRSGRNTRREAARR